MFSVTQCDYRSFCAYAVSFGMALFHFWKKIPQAEQKHFAPCGRCFVRFILSYVNNETQWRQRWLFIAQYSARNHLFLRKFQKSLRVKRNEHILESEIYLITCKLSQKTDPKREKQQYSLDSVNERRLLLFTFSLGSEYCSFRDKRTISRKKLVYKDLRANAFHFVVFLIPFVRQKYIYFTL